MTNLALSENVPELATSAAGDDASDGAVGLPEALLFFGDFARLRANVIPLLQDPQRKEGVL
jgi:hypothetical protein